VGLPVVASESYLASGHNLLSGIDITVAEVYATGTVTLMNGARGATRMLGRRRWGVHMPLLWSLGVPPLYPADAARVRRQALAVRLAYLYGARILYPESGLLSHVPAYVVGSSASWQRACFKDPDDPIQRALRQTFRDVHRYHALHRIPDDPRTPFAFMQGQYDSFGGSIRRDLAFHTPGLAPPHADSGWDLLEVFHPEIRIGNSPRAPMRPWFAGAPRGQMDIVPPESPAARLSRYRLLAIPGWNTMTASLYGRLKAFAAGGGTLFLAAPQLRTDRKQVPLPTLFRNGRVGDLFGVTLRGVGGEIQEGRGSRALTGMDTPYRFYETNARNLPRGIESPHQFPPRAWRVAIEDPATQVLVRESRSGEPLLIRRRVGRGWAYLLTTWDYPGHPMLLPFVKHLLGFLADRQPQPLRAEGSPDLHVFDYPGSGGRRVALLDTDWQAGASPRTVVIRTGRTAMAWEVEPVRIRLIEERHGVWVSPRDESCAASLSGTPARGMTLRLVGFGRHTVELAHPVRVLRLPAEPGWIRERTGDGKTRLTLDLAGPMTIPLAFGPDRKKRS